jgi:hypothetical protein
MDIYKLKFWLPLKSITGVGSTGFSELIEYFGTLEAVFPASPAQL